MTKLARTLLPALLLISSATTTAAKTPTENPMVFGNARLSIITPQLLRLEYAKDGKFIDEPTLFAYDRSNMLPFDSIEVKDLGDGRYEIKTSALDISYHDDGFPFSTSNLAVYYTLDGKKKKFTNRFLPKNNLGGTVDTRPRDKRDSDERRSSEPRRLVYDRR